MSRYIDADALIGMIHEEWAGDPKYYEWESEKAKEAVRFLEKIMGLPHIDIVRCKECKHRYTGLMGKMCIGRQNDDFCSYGKRSE